MRTTVTLDSDTEQMVRRRMAERRVSFKQAINDAIRAGCRQSDEGAPSGFRTETASMGQSHLDLDRALQVVAGLEDDELIRRMQAGS